MDKILNNTTGMPTIKDNISWTSELVGFAGYWFKWAINKKHKESQLLISAFAPFIADENNNYCIVKLPDADESNRFNRCATNLVEGKGRHPSQDAFLRLVSAQARKECYFKIENEEGWSVANHYYPRAFEDVREAEAALEETKNLEFVRGGIDEEFKYILVVKP